MLKEELMSIHAALGIVEKLSEGEEIKKNVGLCRHNLEAAAEQAEALENNLHVVSVDGTAEEAEIAVPAMNLRLAARGIKVSGVFPARAIREVL